MSSDDQTVPSSAKSTNGARPDRADLRVRRGAYLSVAGSAAALAAAATTLLLWATGMFDREIIRITEVVGVIESPSPAPPPSVTAAVPDLPAAGSWSPRDYAPATTGTVFAPTDLVAIVAARAIPSIVTVQSFDAESRSLGSGSGVVIRSEGYIVTNDHVIAGAHTMKVITSDGLSLPASLVGADPLMDIAVLKVETRELVEIEFGAMDDVRTGEPAIAVGNPLGLDGGPSVTAGVISAFDRTLVTDFITGQSLYGLLQTDAPITRGSSGGALLDVEGRLLGITTAIGLSDVGAEGLGFAVPVNLVEGIVADLMSEGVVRHAFLGIRGSSAFADHDDGVESPLGVVISLLEDSAIGAAGAREGDVIVALDGAPVKSMPLLVARLREYRAGDPVMVTVDRDGDAVDIHVVLDAYPS